MGLRLNTNIHSISIQKNLQTHTLNLQDSLGRLASGLRIATAKDDGAGLGISEDMRSETRSVQAAIRQVEDGQGLGELSELTTTKALELLGKMKNLAMEAMSEILTTDQRALINTEYLSTYAEIARLADEKFNDNYVVHGSAYSVFTGRDASEEIEFVTPNFNQAVVTVLGTIPIDNSTTAKNLLPIIEAAEDFLKLFRGVVSGVLSRLDHTHSSLLTQREALIQSESRIRDVDIAEETATYTRHQVLQSTAVSVLSQANVAPENALMLLAFGG